MKKITSKLNKSRTTEVIHECPDKKLKIKEHVNNTFFTEL